jgi:hypothetical protein
MVCNSCGNRVKGLFFTVLRVSMLVPGVDPPLDDYSEPQKIKALLGPLGPPLDHTKYHVDLDTAEEIDLVCGLCLSSDID